MDKNKLLIIAVIVVLFVLWQQQQTRRFQTGQQESIPTTDPTGTQPGKVNFARVFEVISDVINNFAKNRAKTRNEEITGPGAGDYYGENQVENWV